MIHFFPIFSADAENTNFGRALRKIGHPYRIFSASISFRYRSRLELMLVCLPRLAFFALRSGLISLALSRPRPDAVVLGSDVEVLIFAAWRALLRRSTRIVLGSFIFTERGKPRLDALRRAYYRFVLARTDVAVVHSRLEVERYRRLFPARPSRFAFIPFSLDIEARERLLAQAASPPTPTRLVVSAGRSGRDYRTLLRAADGLDAAFRVICDYAGALPAKPHPANVTVLTQCYGDAYLHEILAASVVAVPLAASDISVGQMVMIQAMALGRAIVVTDTPTTRDYVTHEHDALLVPAADADALRAALHRLLDDEPLRACLGRNALATFERSHSTLGFLRRTVEVASE